MKEQKQAVNSGDYHDFLVGKIVANTAQALSTIEALKADISGLLVELSACKQPTLVEVISSNINAKKEAIVQLSKVVQSNNSILLLEDKKTKLKDLKKI